MSARLISSIYQQGDLSAAHHKARGRGHWSFDGKKRARKGKTTIINPAQHAFEQVHGYGSAFTYMDGSAMSMEDVLHVLKNTPTDPLLEMLK
jgi:hypothetical protein